VAYESGRALAFRKPYMLCPDSRPRMNAFLRALPTRTQPSFGAVSYAADWISRKPFSDKSVSFYSGQVQVRRFRQCASSSHSSKDVALAHQIRLDRVFEGRRVNVQCGSDCCQTRRAAHEDVDEGS